jgi:hypothetical protein
VRDLPPPQAMYRGIESHLSGFRKRCHWPQWYRDTSSRCP